MLITMTMFLQRNFIQIDHHLIHSGALKRIKLVNNINSFNINDQIKTKMKKNSNNFSEIVINNCLNCCDLEWFLLIDLIKLIQFKIRNFYEQFNNNKMHLKCIIICLLWLSMCNGIEARPSINQLQSLDDSIDVSKFLCNTKKNK